MGPTATNSQQHTGSAVAAWMLSTPVCVVCDGARINVATWTLSHGHGRRYLCPFAIEMVGRIIVLVPVIFSSPAEETGGSAVVESCHR